MAESFSREKLRHAPQKEGGWEILCDLSSCVTPAGTSNELDVQNEWEENTHTHTHCQPEKLLYTVANPARGLLNREKKKKKSLAAPPPPKLLVRRK